MIKWTGTIWKVGGSWVITIPSDFVQHSQMKQTKEYTITMEEVKP